MKKMANASKVKRLKLASLQISREKYVAALFNIKSRNLMEIIHTPNVI